MSSLYELDQLHREKLSKALTERDDRRIGDLVSGTPEQAKQCLTAIQKSGLKISDKLKETIIEIAFGGIGQHSLTTRLLAAQTMAELHLHEGAQKLVTSLEALKNDQQGIWQLLNYMTSSHNDELPKPDESDSATTD